MTDLSAQTESSKDLQNPFNSVPIELSVCVGKARPLIRDLVTLGENAVLTLDKTVEDPVDIYAGDRLIARGVLEEQEDAGSKQLQVRLVEVFTVQSGS